jgi:hypothetical protein
LLLIVGAHERDEIDRAWLVELDRRDRLLAKEKSSVRPAQEILDQLIPPSPAAAPTFK